MLKVLANTGYTPVIVEYRMVVSPAGKGDKYVAPLLLYGWGPASYDTCDDQV